MEKSSLRVESATISADTVQPQIGKGLGLKSILRERNLADWLDRPAVEYVKFNRLFWHSFSEPYILRASIASRIRSPVAYESLPPELNALRRGFEQEELVALPRATSYRSLLSLNLSVAFATSYHKVEKFETICGDGSEGLNNPDGPGWPPLNASILGTTWTFDSDNHVLINHIFRGWHRPKEFTNPGGTFATLGFSPVGSVSHFSSLSCIGGTQIPVGVAVDIASRGPVNRQQKPYRQEDIIARTALVAANLPALTLMALASCRIDADGNFVHQPLPEAFVFGVAILTEEVMVELFTPYFDEGSKIWKIYCSSFSSIAFGDLTLARMRPHFLFVEFLNLISGIHIHHQNVARTLTEHKWEDHVLAVLSKPEPSSVN
ncbi:uncharacterized protein EI90DRAFT_833276 [Cantharellus anzutake]|uniref:uncharacterized protein n=1 Tax=Cantharellus anzutake TaxID=1750568 RepID=UPI001904D0CB|nr:uncharacterized protein EI90DRAFT_833276 [Cantharellus anzutake]KAF8343140.1 hypothetical protein EI90DRAFT_833276 [Cantharellus anzutake]